MRSRDSGLMRIENIFQDMCIHRTQSEHLLSSLISCMGELYRNSKTKASVPIDEGPSTQMILDETETKKRDVN